MKKCIILLSVITLLLTCSYTGQYIQRVVADEDCEDCGEAWTDANTAKEEQFADLENNYAELTRLANYGTAIADCANDHGMTAGLQDHLDDTAAHWNDANDYYGDQQDASSASGQYSRGLAAIGDGDNQCPSNCIAAENHYNAAGDHFEKPVGSCAYYLSLMGGAMLDCESDLDAAYEHLLGPVATPDPCSCMDEYYE